MFSMRFPAMYGASAYTGFPGALIIAPLELLDRLGALGPPPRGHRYFGVLAWTAASGLGL